MEPRVTALTLATRDLPAQAAFYERLLGRPPFTLVEGDVAFFDLGGLVLCLWTGLDGAPSRGVQLAHNVRTEDDVDAVLDGAVVAGATIVRAARQEDWGGRSGVFADPEGHEWEVAWNPQWPLDEAGRVAVG